MAEVTVKSMELQPWGNVVHISNGIVELMATIDFGPRIIRYGFVGGANMFFEDIEAKITQEGASFESVGGGAWNIYGGHRLWTSPEAVPRTTYPDNEKVGWIHTENGIILNPNEEKWNQIQKEIEIKLDPLSSEVSVHHRITNTGAWIVSFAPWALSVMAPGGQAVIPNTIRETGLLPNRILSLWPYSKMNDKRVTWGDKFIVLEQHTDCEGPFKFGSNNEAGWAAYHNAGNLFVKYYNHLVEGKYPDYGVSFETYTNDSFLELETLGELKSVEPKETVIHEEVWNLFAGFEFPSITDELAMGLAVKKVLK